MNVLWIHVRNGDGSNMLEELKQNGYRATLISSTESFLDYGETTMLVGVDNDQCDDVIRMYLRAKDGEWKYIKRFW